MNRLRFALMTLALVLTFAASAPKAITIGNVAGTWPAALPVAAASSRTFSADTR